MTACEILPSRVGRRAAVTQPVALRVALVLAAAALCRVRVDNAAQSFAERFLASAHAGRQASRRCTEHSERGLLEQSLVERDETVGELVVRVDAVAGRPVVTGSAGRRATRNRSRTAGAAAHGPSSAAMSVCNLIRRASNRPRGSASESELQSTDRGIAPVARRAVGTVRAHAKRAPRTRIHARAIKARHSRSAAV
jgi:hypothetical protein